MWQKIILVSLITVWLFLVGTAGLLFWKSKKILLSVSESAQKATTQIIVSPEVAGESTQE